MTKSTALIEKLREILATKEGDGRKEALIALAREIAESGDVTELVAIITSEDVQLMTLADLIAPQKGDGREKAVEALAEKIAASEDMSELCSLIAGSGEEILKVVGNVLDNRCMGFNTANTKEAEADAPICQITLALASAIKSGESPELVAINAQTLQSLVNNVYAGAGAAQQVYDDLLEAKSRDDLEDETIEVVEDVIETITTDYESIEKKEDAEEGAEGEPEPEPKPEE